MKEMEVLSEVRNGVLDALNEYAVDLAAAAKTCDETFSKLKNMKLEDLGLDSLDMIEIVMFIEDDLEISLDGDIEEKLIGAHNVAHFIELVQGQYILEKQS